MKNGTSFNDDFVAALKWVEKNLPKDLLGEIYAAVGTGYAENPNAGILSNKDLRALGIACYESLSEEERKEVDEEVEREVQQRRKMREEGKKCEWIMMPNGQMRIKRETIISGRGK